MLGALTAAGAVAGTATLAQHQLSGSRVPEASVARAADPGAGDTGARAGQARSAETSRSSGLRRSGDAPDLQASGKPTEERAADQVAAKATARAEAKATRARQERRERALPAGSGTGRRVVYSEGRQRVWLVAEDGDVERTYLVSGSIYDNLDPGTYSVYSRSEQAWGIDDSGTMKHFVRFTRGPNAAIGFHDIPVKDGVALQGLDELGTATSHGCIRQKESDAIALWEFAPLGTAVVVTP